MLLAVNEPNSREITCGHERRYIPHIVLRFVICEVKQWFRHIQLEAFRQDIILTDDESLCI